MMGGVYVAGKPKQVTTSIFNCVKRLIDSGAPTEEITEYMKLSSTTVNRIRRAESIEEYKNMTYASVRAARAKESEKPQPAPANLPVQEIVHKHEQSVTVIANHYMMEELKEQTKTLKLISNKLTFIVEELTGTKGAAQ